MPRTDIVSPEILTPTMNFILEATVQLSVCLALTSAQAPQTITLRGWFYYPVNSNYHSWRHGFPAGTTLVMLVTGNDDVDGFFHAQLYDEARGNIDDFWTYLSYAHAECELNDEEEEISLAYMYYVCKELNGSLIFCPKPCDANPCPVNSDCFVTQHGLFEDNYQCNCHPGSTWDSVQQDCVGAGAVPPGGNATTLPNNTMAVSTVSGARPFSYHSSSSSLATTSSAVIQSTIPPPLKWDNFTRLYTNWRYGFPPGTTLSSVLPGVIDPHDVLDNLYHRQANGNADEFWNQMFVAGTVGDLTNDYQLLSLAYIYYLCRETLSQNSECPNPCGDFPCAAVTCTVTGAGLFSDNYQCNCEEHHHWDPQRSRCVFCRPGTAWSEVRQQCVQGGTTTVAPTVGPSVPGSPTAQWDAWSTWSACSSVCGAGTRYRLRACRRGFCSGPTREEVKCQGTGFWLCFETAVYVAAGVLTLLLLVACALVFLSMRDSDENDDRNKKLAGSEVERTRKRNAASTRRATVKPRTRRPTSQRQPRFNQRRKPSSKWPAERRQTYRPRGPRDYLSDTDQQWEPSDYPSDTDQQRGPSDYPSNTDQQRGPSDYPSNTDQQRGPSDYPSNTDQQWDPRDYPSETHQQWEYRDYPSNTYQQWGPTDYQDQVDRNLSYTEYPPNDQRVSYDPYRQSRYYYD